MLAVNLFSHNYHFFGHLFYIQLGILFYPLLLCWVGVHCGIYTGSFNVSNILFYEFTPSTVSLCPSPPIPGVASTGIILHLCTCVHIFCALIILLTLFPIPPPTLVPAFLQGRTCSVHLFSDFVEQEREKIK
jgi:hypothetical protein